MILAALAAASVAAGGYCQPSDRTPAQTVEAWVVAWTGKRRSALRATILKDAVVDFYGFETLTAKEVVSRFELNPITVFDRRIEGDRVFDTYTSPRRCLPLPRKVRFSAAAEEDPPGMICSDPSKPDMTIEYRIKEGCIAGMTLGTP